MSKELKNSEHIKIHARLLRKKQTESEKLLWNELRNRRLLGFKFLRQHPIVYRIEGRTLKYFVLDFYCDQKKLAVELDGPIHDMNIESDKNRDEELVNRGIITLRIKNKELADIKAVLLKIQALLKN